jgi:glycerol-3-phosphate cytidylyltransferase
MKVGFTCSAFDLLHAGHVQMLKDAKEECDYLIVGLQTDPTIDRPKEKKKPIQTLVERSIQLNAIKYVDEVIPYETEKDLEDIFQMYNISVRIIGEEYQGKNFTGKEICVKKHIKIVYNKREHRFSTTDLRKRIIDS